MRSITYEEYFDKVYGCMIGKCVAGTAGAPYEGMKQRLNLRFSAEEADTTLPNDDLDLQVLWLEILERKGIYVTSDDLADIFLERCPYSPGEYAVFKKNYKRNIHPPMSGTYNNPYYLEGMGCPIRSEIWACISPGNMMLASELAAIDGVIDHGGNSVYAECFLAALEAEAFFNNDIRDLIEKSLLLIPETSKMYTLINDVSDWCEKFRDWETVREKIIHYYGHPDCTNVFQNMGFLLTALLKGEMDFIKTMEIAVNCGYDTDCTGATAGAVIGLILGAGKLNNLYGFSDQTYTLGVTASRRSDKISDLAEDICRVGVHFSHKGKNNVPVKNNILQPLIPDEEVPPAISISVQYRGEPVISPDKNGEVELVITNHTSDVIKGFLNIQSKTLTPSLPDIAALPENHPQGMNHNAPLNIQCLNISLKAKEIFKLPVRFQIDTDSHRICDGNRVDVMFRGNIESRFTFGFASAVPWLVYGPYWENNKTIHNLNVTQSYMEQFQGNTIDEKINNIRDYQISAFVDEQNNHHDLKSLSLGNKNNGYELVYTYSDLIRMSNVIGYQGPCCVYLTRSFFSANERECRLDIGCSDDFSMWMNGEKIAEKRGVSWWTGENIHIHKVHIKEGANHIAVRLGRHSADSCFNIHFLEDEQAALGLLSFPQHIVDFEYIKP